MKSCTNFQTYISIFQRKHHTFFYFGIFQGERGKNDNAIFKICPKLAWKWCSCETSVYSIILGIIGGKKWSLFSNLGVRSPIFWPKITKIGRFRVPKNGTLNAQIQKRTPLFVANYAQKRWIRHLFHMNIAIGWVLGKFWKLPILGSFLANFPL